MLTALRRPREIPGPTYRTRHGRFTRSENLSRRRHRQAFSELLWRSGVPEMLEAWMPNTGRPRELSPREILFGMLVAIDEDRVAHLTAGHEALFDSEPGRYKSVTYRQFTNTHQVMIRAIDPSPCPSYKGVPEDHRLAHLLSHRSEVDQVLAVLRFEIVTDALLDASV